MSGKFLLAHSLAIRKFQSCGQFRTGLDLNGQNLDLWDRVWSVSRLAVMSFALVFIFAAWHVYGFHTRGNHCDLFCSHVKGCAWTDSLDVSFACLHRSALFTFCLRHWSLIDYTLPVKMCGTHLGVIRGVIVVGSVNHLLRCASRTLGWKEEVSLCFPWNGWFVAWNARLVHVGLWNCQVCPSCISGLVFPSGCIELSDKGLRDSWRTPRLQQKQRFLFLRIRRSQHRLELLIWNQRKEKSRALTIQMKATNHRQTRKTRRKERLEEMMTDRDLQGWECMNHLTPMMQRTYCPLPQAWLWESRQWLLHWRVRRTDLIPLSRVRILFNKTFAGA